MKKIILRIAGITVLAFGLFFVFQTEALGNIFEGLNVVDEDGSGNGVTDTGLALVDGPTDEDLPEIELPTVEDFVQRAQGTVVAVTEDEALFVQKLDLTDEELAMSFEDWMASEYLNDLMRLTEIEEELEVGTEIEITFEIATFSIPPVVPVQSYEIIG